MTPSQETKSAREFSFERIREVVRSIGDKSQYDLVDINPYSFEGEVYSPETPIECVIVVCLTHVSIQNVHHSLVLIILKNGF